MKKPCIKCLLAELDYDEYRANLLEHIKNFPRENRVSDDEYDRRLGICRTCGSLSDGMCLECGCYVELRALKPKMYCAGKVKKW